MNLTESIYFDGDALIAGRASRIIYNGFLCESNPQEIYMHCGYGLLWEGLQEIKLLKGVSGYEADINFVNVDNVFFCFRSSDGKWDNNNGKNYIVPVNKRELSLVKRNDHVLPDVPKLKKVYYIRKKIKVAFFRTISLIARLLSGNIDYFRRKKERKGSIKWVQTKQY